MFPCGVRDRSWSGAWIGSSWRRQGKGGHSQDKDGACCGGSLDSLPWTGSCEAAAVAGGCRASLALGCWCRQGSMGNTRSHFVGNFLLHLSILLTLFIGGVIPQIVVCIYIFSPCILLLYYILLFNLHVAFNFCELSLWTFYFSFSVTFSNITWNGRHFQAFIFKIISHYHNLLLLMIFLTGFSSKIP